MTLRDRLIRLLRWSEKYTKTDMVYLFTAGAWTNFDLAIQSVLSLLLSVALANTLAPAAYGLYQYLVAIAGLVAAVSLSGMNIAVTQAVARGYEGVLRASVRIQLRWAIVPAILSAAGALYYFTQAQPGIGLGLVAIALFTPLVQTFNTYVAFLDGKQEFRAFFFLRLVANLVYYAAMFAALPFIRSGALFIVINVIASAAGNFYAYRATLRRFKPNDKVDPAALSYGKHLSILNGFSAAMSQLDSVLVFHFLGAAPLAIYSLATLIPERVAGFFTFVELASLPKFANSPLAYIRANLIGKIGRLALAGIIVAVCYALAAPLLFHLLFPAYARAIPFTQGYAAIIAIGGVTSLSQITLYAKRFTREIYVFSIVQPILLVGLQIPLLLTYGIWGMVVARLISGTIGIALSLWFTYHPLAPPLADA
ncbi:MAG: oligosaccharide flippase family protein [Minisyncoccia bacterium]